MSLRLHIAIIEYGVGNTYSVGNALERLGYNFTVTDDKDKIKGSDVVLLPGVGAYDKAMQNLRDKGLHELIVDVALNKQKPLLGICVGMQILSETSDENGNHKGLHLIPGDVKKFDLPAKFTVPHVGWNEVHYSQHSAFDKLPQGANFYYDHSYHFVTEEKYIAAATHYGNNVVAAVHRDNIFGVQFHPEKSQVAGLKFFRGFMNWAERYA